MKQEPLFYVNNNTLFNIENKEPIDLSNLTIISHDKLALIQQDFCKITIPWSVVEISDEIYNEEFLANLRDILKTYEEKKKFVILTPVIDKALDTPEKTESFTAAFNHTARRVKDCSSVVGFELPVEITEKGFDENSSAALFIETLAKKHSHYIYFVSKKTDGVTIPPDFVIL